VLDIYLIANVASTLPIQNPKFKEENKKWRKTSLLNSILRWGIQHWVMPLWRAWRWYRHPFGEEVENKASVWKTRLLLWPEKFWAFIQPHGCPCPYGSARTNKKQVDKENSQKKGFAWKMKGFRMMRSGHGKWKDFR